MSIATFALVAGWLADRFKKNRVLAAGCFLAGDGAGHYDPALHGVVFALIFTFGGIYVAIERWKIPSAPTGCESAMAPSVSSPR
jgi:hypothetical protein